MSAPDVPTTVYVTPQEQTAAKAIVALATALFTAITTAVADGHVTVWEIVLGVLTTVIAGASVYAVTNDPPRPKI